MAVMYNQVKKTVYYHTSTQNLSFIQMSNYLRDIGITNDKWMLTLLDPDLATPGLDIFDERLPQHMKIKVLRECLYNPMYFFREVIRIPDSGQAKGVRFGLHRGNMALLFCLMLNMNIFMEMPRQTGKTVSSLAWYLYLFNFGTTNAEMSFLNKRLEDSNSNLQIMRDTRALLPSYLRMDSVYDRDGVKVKARDNVKTLQNVVNHNRVKTIASARNRVMAASLMRGRTTPNIYIDEYAFIPYNDIVYTNMVPAYNTASLNAKANHSPYGILITTTPGMLATEEGLEAFTMKESATPFSERWYDLNAAELADVISANTNSSFVYLRFTYQQIGKSEEWFKKLCIDMKKNWDGIRREILLEWSQSTENSPFHKEDLDAIKGLIRQPIKTVLMLNKYQFNIYEQINLKYPPLIGVDVSGGYKRDSSAITVVDSYSTRVTAEMNCNYICTQDLAMVIYKLVSESMPNAVVNVERNGGYGATVISRLKNTAIKGNLFYTIKDKVVEEQIMGAQIRRKTQKTKVFGSDSTHEEREKLMEIMRDRVDYHKDKIVSNIIYSELCGLEIKRNGRIEHSSNTHDDQIFSWLWALYIYYYGGDLINNWGITRRTLKTDADIDEDFYDIKEDALNITEDIGAPVNDEVDAQLESLKTAPGRLLYKEWLKEQDEIDEDAMARILSTKQGREAYAAQYHIPIEDINAGIMNIPRQVFEGFYQDDESNIDMGNLSELFKRV